MAQKPGRGVWRRVRDLFNRRRFLVTIILSFVLVWFIPMSLLIRGNSSVLSSARENAVESNRSMLTNFSGILDAKLGYIRSVIMHISSDNKLMQLMLRGDDLTGEDRYNIHQIINANAMYFLSDSLISEVLIYVQRPGLVITSSTVYTTELFDMTVRQFDGMPASEWFASRCIGDMLYDEIRVVNLGGQDRIFCIQSLPLSYGSSVKGLIAVVLDESKLAKLFNVSDRLFDTYVVSPTGSILYATDASRACVSGVLAAPLGDSSFVLDRDEYTLIRQDVNAYDVSLVAVGEMPLYLEHVARLQNSLMLQMLLCVAFSVLIITLLTQRNYRSIRQLMRHASLVAAPSENQTVSEVEYISRSFDQAASRQEELEQELSDTVQDIEKMNRMFHGNAAAMRDNLYRALATGNADRYEQLGDIMAHFGVELPGDSFVSLIVQFNPAIPAERPDQKDMDAALDLAAKELETLLSASERHCVVAVTGQNTLTVLLNCESNDQKAAEADALDALRALATRLEESTPYTINAGISNFVNSMADIDIACQQARVALDHGLMTVSRKSDVFLYRNIHNSDKEYYYPIDMERRLIDMMLAGDLRNVRRLLSSIYDENLSRRTLQPQMIHFFFMDVACTLMKVVGMLSADLGYMDASNQALLADVINYRRAEDFRYEVDRLIENVCTLVNRSKDDTSKKLKTRIEQYIEENYTNLEMSQASVAEVMDISASYLSKYFKQEFRENMLAYVNRKRVMLAKRLLATTDLLLDDIATQTGFGSSKTLIRVFKQYEGVTPGTYRSIESARKGNNTYDDSEN